MFQQINITALSGNQIQCGKWLCSNWDLSDSENVNNQTKPGLLPIPYNLDHWDLIVFNKNLFGQSVMNTKDFWEMSVNDFRTGSSITTCVLMNYDEFLAYPVFALMNARFWRHLFYFQFWFIKLRFVRNEWLNNFLLFKENWLLLHFLAIFLTNTKQTTRKTVH